MYVYTYNPSPHNQTPTPDYERSLGKAEAPSQMFLSVPMSLFSTENMTPEAKQCSWSHTTHVERHHRGSVHNKKQPHLAMFTPAKLGKLLNASMGHNSEDINSHLSINLKRDKGF